jgi:hypothetical protein
MLDHLAYPHIFDRIWSHLDYPTKIIFRETSKALHARVDRDILKHVNLVETIVGNHNTQNLDTLSPTEMFNNGLKCSSLIELRTKDNERLPGPDFDWNSAVWQHRLGLIEAITWAIHDQIENPFLPFVRGSIINWDLFPRLTTVRRAPVDQTPKRFDTSLLTMLRSVFSPDEALAIVDHAFIHHPSQRTWMRFAHTEAAKHILNVIYDEPAVNSFGSPEEWDFFEEWGNPSPPMDLVVLYHPRPVPDSKILIGRKFSYMWFDTPEYNKVTYVGYENVYDLLLDWEPDFLATEPTLEEIKIKIKKEWGFQSNVRLLTHDEYRAEVGEDAYEFETLADLL